MGGFGLEEVGGENWETLWERGGYPRAYLAGSTEDSFVWRRQFVKTYLERDLPDWASGFLRWRWNASG